jgi:asparagine synthase (glutamine-hydrolysing)
MCGICGKIDPSGVGHEEIQRMTSVLSHRGPDDQGIYIDRNVGFGHRRLSIIDLDSGKQPMSNEDGSIWITYNGEIYNFKDIKGELESRHRFRTKSDTEVILHLYEEKRERCLEDLRGMFAFAIYDFNTDTLFVARDHLGQKPLYYFHDESTFAFASEIKSILALKPGLNELDRDAMCEYLTLRIITPPRSMFRRIRKLPPAHYLIYKNGKTEVERYWNLSFTPKHTGSFEDISGELKNLMRSTVSYHLVSDVPVGAFLSGGLDSSLVVALMSEFADGPFKTFSGDVPYKDHSEIPYARMVSKEFDTESHELTFIPSLIRTLPEIIWHLDEPSDPFSICMYYIAKLARKEVKVVLGGDGGDELFGGYDRYYGNIYASYLSALPGPIRNYEGGALQQEPELFLFFRYLQRSPVHGFL